MGRPRKEVEVAVVDETIPQTKSTVVNKVDKEKEELKKKNDELSEMLLKMQAQLNELATSSIGQVKETTLLGKKVKCINLMRNPLNVSTEPLGRGKMYEFSKYGETKLIKFDDLSDIVASYPNTMGQGLLYIANKDAVEELGLTDEYTDIHPKELLDEIIYLRRDMDVDIFLSLPKDLQESMAVDIARLINAKESIDLNRLRKIKDETTIDIEEIAKTIIAEQELNK